MRALDLVDVLLGGRAGPGKTRHETVTWGPLANDSRRYLSKVIISRREIGERRGIPRLASCAAHVRYRSKPALAASTAVLRKHETYVVGSALPKNGCHRRSETCNLVLQTVLIFRAVTNDVQQYVASVARRVQLAPRCFLACALQHQQAVGRRWRVD